MLFLVQEQETGFGVQGGGQLGSGPDYYAATSWDNAPLYPELMHSRFDPYIGKGGCPGCGKKTRKTFMFSVDPRCDGSYQCRNIKKILKLDDWHKEPAFQAAIYQEKTWIGNQAGFFIGESKDVVMVVPPCFFPPLANAELNALNDAVYDYGGSLLVLGGLTGANFISQNLRAEDGYGYVDTRGDRPQFTMDAVWSAGPFVLQKAAVTTEFFFGPRFLEGTESTWGIPVSELPPETIHYYMDANEVSIVFEIPAGTGRILFMGYDFGYMAPHWMEALMLARRELQIQRETPVMSDASDVRAEHIAHKPRPLLKSRHASSARRHVAAAAGKQASRKAKSELDTLDVDLNEELRTLGDLDVSPTSVAGFDERVSSGRSGSDATLVSSESLPEGASGDALDVEIARAVDKLEARMKSKLARVDKRTQSSRQTAQGRRDSDTTRRVADDMHTKYAGWEQESRRTGGSVATAAMSRRRTAKTQQVEAQSLSVRERSAPK